MPVREETNDHIFMSLPFTKHGWNEVEGMIGLKNVWVGNDIEEAFRRWCTNKETRRFKGLPINVAWGIWLDTNLKLFEDEETLPLKCVLQE